MSGINYRQHYNEYWSQPDRWGTDSFTDVELVAEQILSTCGSGGKLLDVGCGMGLLVKKLLQYGVDAYGIDVASTPIEQANHSIPHRFRTGSILNLPYSEESYKTLVCTDVLEHLVEEDVPQALNELHRVAGRYVFVTVATSADRDNKWHLTIHDRQWWDNLFFESGFRRHPLLQQVVPYESFEHEETQIILIYEKISPKALEKYPLDCLKAQRDLHMDMLRETGRRSDAHIARYMMACEYIRPGDVVLDATCGLGYGSAVMTSGSLLSRIMGIDNSRFAVDYAIANYGKSSSIIDFHCGDAENLSHLPNQSIDFVASFETLEHLPHPDLFLAEVHRVLRPDGRIVLSVPNNWTDETGKDPNPDHLHVYDCGKLRGQLDKYFQVEKVYSQVSGGGLKLTDHPRRLREVSDDDTQTCQAEWWLVVAMKDPVGAVSDDYKETSFPDYSNLDDYHITAFGRDYDNPWLVKAMVSMGMRSSNPLHLEQLAQRALVKARKGSADAGAALCVLGYRLLGQPQVEIDDVQQVLDRIKAYHKEADNTVHTWRWRISNQYVAGRLLLIIGKREEARLAFLQCAEMDCVKFSPLLATKTVDAFFQAGLISANDGHEDEARKCWEGALREVQRVLGGSWTNIWGKAEQPVSFGLPESCQIMDLATRCAYGLLVLDNWLSRPHVSWTWTHKRTVRELTRWINKLEKRKDWYDKQLINFKHTVEEKEHVIQELREWINKLEEGKSWLEEHAASWKKTGDVWKKTADDWAKMADERKYLLHKLLDTRWLRLGRKLGFVNLLKLRRHR